MNGRGAEAVAAASARPPPGTFAAGGVHSSGAGQLAIGCASGTCRASGIAWPGARPAKMRRIETSLKKLIIPRIEDLLPRESGQEALPHSLCPFFPGGLLPEAYAEIAEDGELLVRRH